MKPKRYPYSGRMKRPTMTITKKPLAYIGPVVEIDCRRSNDVEFKNDGLVFNKKPHLINVSSMAEAMEEFGKAYKEFVAADKKEREKQNSILEDITSRIEKCEMTLNGCVGKYTKKTGSNIKPEEIPGYQEPVLKFDYRH